MPSVDGEPLAQRAQAAAHAAVVDLPAHAHQQPAQQRRVRRARSAPRRARWRGPGPAATAAAARRRAGTALSGLRRHHPALRVPELAVGATPRGQQLDAAALATSSSSRRRAAGSPALQTAPRPRASPPAATPGWPGPRAARAALDQERRRLRSSRRSSAGSPRPPRRRRAGRARSAGPRASSPAPSRAALAVRAKHGRARADGGWRVWHLVVIPGAPVRAGRAPKRAARYHGAKPAADGQRVPKQSKHPLHDDERRGPGSSDAPDAARLRQLGQQLAPRPLPAPAGAGRPRSAGRTAARAAPRPAVARVARRAARTAARLALRPPGWKRGASSSAPGSSGSASASISSVTRLSRARPTAWPARPKPVTSVAPRTPVRGRRLGGLAVERQPCERVAAATTAAPAPGPP